MNDKGFLSMSSDEVEQYRPDMGKVATWRNKPVYGLRNILILELKGHDMSRFKVELLDLKPSAKARNF